MFERSPRFTSDEATPLDRLVGALFLVALAAGNRVSELAAFNREGIIFSQEGMVLPVQEGFLYKNQRAATKPPDVCIPRLWRGQLPHPLCPVSSVQRFIDGSASTEGALFVNSKTGNRLKPSSISHLICKLIREVHPHILPKAHDVRKVASSIAWTRGVPLDVITARTFWHSPDVFIKRYLIPRTQDPGPCVAIGTTAGNSSASNQFQ